jgi:hypothetical protein
MWTGAARSFLRDLLEIELPILQPPMAGVQGNALAIVPFLCRGAIRLVLT